MTITFARLILAAGFLAILGVAACSTTAPAPFTPLTIVLSGPSTVQGHDTTVGDAALYVCDYRLIATAKGGYVGDAATWASAHVTYQGQGVPTYSTPIDPGSLFAPYTSLGPGQQLSNVQHNVWTQPFQFTLVLYYTTLDSPTTDSTTFSYACQ